MRFAVPVGEATEFVEGARTVLGALAQRPGYLRGQVGRAYDEPERWLLLTEWESVGAYRRALSSFDVRVPLMNLAPPLDEPSAFESLASAGPGGPVEVSTSDRVIS